jgi:hypothetical protein
MDPRCKVEELEAKLQRMEQKARGLVDETAQDIQESIGERFMKRFG